MMFFLHRPQRTPMRRARSSPPCKTWSIALIAIGAFVDHGVLGFGKVIDVVGDMAYVYFKDVTTGTSWTIADAKIRTFRMRTEQLALSPVAYDDVLSNLAKFTQGSDGNHYLKRGRVGIEHLEQSFLVEFPQGFQDEKYFASKSAGERSYKLAAQALFEELFGNGQFDKLLDACDIAELTSRTLRVISAVNFVEKRFGAITDYEKVLLENQPEALLYFRALKDLIAAKSLSGKLFDEYAHTIKALPDPRKKIRTWNLATAIPSIARPDLFAFLKPKEAQLAAEVLQSELNYSADLNWKTYHSFMNILDLCKVKLAHLNPQDYVDVQSFLLVTCGAYGKA